LEQEESVFDPNDGMVPVPSGSSRIPLPDIVVQPIMANNFASINSGN